MQPMEAHGGHDPAAWRPPGGWSWMAQMAHIGPAYGAALESTLPEFIAQLEARVAPGDTEADAAPELATPRAGSPFAGLRTTPIPD